MEPQYCAICNGVPCVCAPQPVEAKRVRLPETVKALILWQWKCNGDETYCHPNSVTDESLINAALAELKREGIEG